MSRYILFEQRANALSRAETAMRERRISLGLNPDRAPDGKPWSATRLGTIIEGQRVLREPSDTDPGAFEPTGRAVWVPERAEDIKPEDASREVVELPEEFRPREPREPAPRREPGQPNGNGGGR